MAPIVEYTSFRSFLLDYYKEQHDRRGFTWRMFAAAAGYSSPVFLKLVCDGKNNLSELGLERVAAAIGLTGADLLYFRALVHYEQEKNVKRREVLYAELREVAKSNSFKVIGEEQYDYFESWRNPVLREIAPRVKGAKASEIADLILEDTSAAEVKKAISTLLKVGFLKEENGGYVASANTVSTGIIDAGKLAVRNMHRQMGELAVKAIDNVPAAERDISGMTLGLTAEAFDRIVEETAAFRRRIAAIASESAGTDRVYRMNLQLFPLTRQLPTEQLSAEKGGENA